MNKFELWKHSDLRGDVPEYLDAIVVLTIDSLLASVKLLALVYVVATGVTSPDKTSINLKYSNKPSCAHIEKGAIRRTTCCEFFGPLRRGILEGSKSGG